MSSLLVIESGGTKSTWVFQKFSKEKQFSSEVTVGLHPRELSEKKIKKIKHLISENKLENSAVYFYGAGCESIEAKQKIKDFLEEQKLFVKQVETDIYAACLALLNDQSGIVGILGTGAVAACFDGKKIVRQTSGLGYLIGDEGSGFDIGKRLLQHYFKKNLPIKINQAIEIYFNHQSILHRIHADDGRMIIAGLTKIVTQFRDEGIIQLILAEAFDAFYENAIKPIGIKIRTDIHFVGSVAYYFKYELIKSLEKNNFRLGKMEKEAVFKVFEFLFCKTKF